MRLILLALLLPVLCLSAACGFEPVYGINKNTPLGAESVLERVQISNIPDRDGQFLRNNLITRFYRDGRPADPLYRLEVTPVRESIRDLDITKEADATRSQIRENVQIRLIRMSDNEIVLDRNIISVASFNILESEFSNRVSEQNTRENVLIDLGRQIEQHITLYLKRAQ